MKFAPYTSGRLKELKVCITSYSEDRTSLNVVGGVNITGIISAASISISTTTATSNFANLNITGVSTFAGNINANGNIVGDNATNISGISSVTATSLFGNLTGNVTGNVSGIATYTSEWIITANGSSDYKFTGPGFDGTELDPTIYLKRGQQYKFTNHMGAHPFQIRTAINGSAYNDGISNNGVSNGTLTWDVQMDAPNVLYYQCTSHAGMVGKIYIGNSGDSINIGTGVTITSSGIHVTGVVTATNFVGISSVTANKFFGDGSGLSNTGAALAEASGTERLVLTNLTSGTMVSAATTSDVTFNANTDTFTLELV